MKIAAKSPLIIKDLTHAYTSGSLVLKGINITVNSPEIIAIIGPSGTGKSTLLRCINRLVEATSGEIIIDDINFCKSKGVSFRKQRRRLGMIFQEYNLVERLTVIENILSGRLGYMTFWKAARRKFSQKDIDQAFDLLDFVGLTEHSKKRADKLSGGQRQRVGIARAIMQDPKILLADEPTSSLDPKTSVEIMELISHFSREKKIPVLINLHDVNLAKRFADRIIGMSEGHIIFDGKPNDLTDDSLKQIYGGESWLK
jgi:phosphonate transport system ATP-binding protein